MDRNKQIELVILAIGWLFAVMVQFMITDTLASYLRGHSIMDLRDELIVGFVIGSLIALGICLFAKSRIELESAIIISVIMAMLIGCWPYLSVKGRADWVYPVFFVECAPMCALMWKATYKWFIRMNVAEVHKAEDLRSEVKQVVKAESLPQTTSQGQEVANKTEDPKKEEKPIEQAPQPPKDPPAKLTPKKSRWRLNP